MNVKNITTRWFLTLCFIIVGFSYSQIARAENDQQFAAEDFQHWMKIAYIANATYQSQKELEESLQTLGYRLDIVQQIPGYSVSYVLATNETDKSHLIAVRGTSNIENVIVDTAFVLVPDEITGIDIHQGFLFSSQYIFGQLSTRLKADYTVNTTGHSLGGAEALILAMMMDAKGYTVGDVITFGQPKVTNITGSRKFKHLDVKRLVTPKDVVPLVPPIDPMNILNLSVFWHQGVEIILYENNSYAVLTGMESMKRAEEFLNDIPGKQHLSNHYMSSYINHLKTKLKTVEKVKYQSDFSVTDWVNSFISPGEQK